MAEPDYYPLKKGLVLAYRSLGEGGGHTFQDEILDVVQQGGRAVASVRKTVRAGEKVTTYEFTVERDAHGVYRRGELELPLPLAVGKKWDSGECSYEVRALDKTVEVIAGTFKSCLHVVYFMGEGSGEVDYAPGVGCLRRRQDDSENSFEYELTRATGE